MFLSIMFCYSHYCPLLAEGTILFGLKVGCRAWDFRSRIAAPHGSDSNKCIGF